MKVAKSFLYKFIIQKAPEVEVCKIILITPDRPDGNIKMNFKNKDFDKT